MLNPWLFLLSHYFPILFFFPSLAFFGPKKFLKHPERLNFKQSTADFLD